MIYRKLHLEDLGVTAESCCFSPENGIGECHVILHIDPKSDSFIQQLNRIYAAEDRIPQMKEFGGFCCVMKRYFLSDSTNQQPLMRQEPNVALSLIQQPPLDGSKVAVWLYMLQGVDVLTENGMTVVRHGGYTHLWKMGMCSPHGDSATQTENVLAEYEEELQRFGATLAKHCVRTWFYVRDVDTQYAGLVKARKENFIRHGLTEQTHYISSTGIGGNPADTSALVQMGAYALTGFQPEQQRYLYASTHLNRTSEYGVTFERGTALDFGDRTQVFVSGTASINNRGEVVHVGDVVKQTERMWENVEMLLAEADTTFEDVMQIVVYLRDVADYSVVNDMFHQRFPNIPTVITLAPVCRPTWLVEMECIAVKEKQHSEYRNF